MYLNLIVFDSSFAPFNHLYYAIQTTIFYAQSRKFCQIIVYSDFLRDFKFGVCLFRSCGKFFVRDRYAHPAPNRLFLPVRVDLFGDQYFSVVID